MKNYKTFYMYATAECGFCKRAKDLLEAKGLKFIVLQLNRDHDTLVRLKKEMDWNTVPMIFEFEGRDQKFIGGYTDLVDYLGVEDGK